jgi:protease-4
MLKLQFSLALSADDSDGGQDGEEQSQNIGKNVYSVYPSTDLRQLPDGSIAYIDIDGPMLKQGDWCSYGSEDYSELMYGLMQAPNVAGVIIDMDSPGGQADGTASFADAIRRCATVKPVLGFIDDGMAASAAYWDISACSEIYCGQLTDMVGSIGVYTTIADWNSYYASQGLPVKDVYAPQSTDKNRDYREAIEGNDDLLRQELSVIADAFISAVRKNRKAKISGSDWATGKLYFADDALKLGLIDGIKSFDQVVFRMNRLISANKKSNDNTMAFEKTLTTAGAEAFEVVEGGFLLSETELNNIEASLASHETAVQGLQSQLSEAQAAQRTAEENLASANQTIQADNARIQTLEGQVATLEQGTEEPKQTARDKDDLSGGDQTPYHLRADNPMNQFADGVTPKKPN